MIERELRSADHGVAVLVAVALVVAVVPPSGSQYSVPSARVAIC